MKKVRVYRALIFDLGDVLVRRTNQAPTTLAAFADQITHHEAWKRVKRGQCSFIDVIRYLIPNEQHLLAQDLLSYVPVAFELVPECLALIQRCKQAGYGVYLLSNFSREFFEPLAQRFNLYQLFDGMVISYQVGHLKPEREIYFRLLDSYNLRAEECIFIDDLPENIHAAQLLGIHGIVWTDYPLVAQQLKLLGIFDEM